MKSNENKWSTLSHNGPLFPPEYEHKNFDIKIGEHWVKLSKEAEEVLFWWTQKHNTEYVKDEVFKNNFWNDFKTLLPSHYLSYSFPDNWNYTSILEYIDKEKRNKIKITKEDKNKEKQEKEKIKEQYGYAIIDGQKIELLNYVIIPPGLFMGRGDHPMRGKLKRRIQPEDVTINIDTSSSIPNPPEGHAWKEVIHNKKGIYTASWKSSFTGITSISPTRTSSIVQESDKKKFDRARYLAKNKETIKQYIQDNIVSNDENEKQLATVSNLIYNYAIRVGNEKDEEVSADTVGASSLRKEHIIFKSNSKIEFDFLGKDSIRYNREYIVDEIFYNTLKYFYDKAESRLFTNVNSITINEFLNKGLTGITAKDFRTATASELLSSYLKTKDVSNLTEKEKINFFNDANLEVAKKLNHQSNVGKTFDITVENIEQKIKDCKIRINDITNHQNELSRTDSKTFEKEYNTLEKEKIKLQTKIEDYKEKIILKNKTKGIALGTSKTNYIDPRIIISWCNTYNVPLKKILTASLIKKNEWAINIENTFFEEYI
jgi:DNA topoisomerase-1